MILIIEMKKTILTNIQEVIIIHLINNQGRSILQIKTDKKMLGHTIRIIILMMKLLFTETQAINQLKLFQRFQKNKRKNKKMRKGR